jgi:membrane protease YdiL (CAAX protease family)
MMGESSDHPATPRASSRLEPAPRLDVPLLLFFALTFAGAWALWLAAGVLAGPAPRQVYDGRWLVSQLGVFVPALAALAVSAPTGKRFRRSSAVTLLAVFVPATLLGSWIAQTATRSIPGIGWPLTLVVAVAGVAVMAFFSPLNRCLINPGSDVRVGPVRAAWVLGAGLYPLATFLLAWLLVGGPTRGPLAAALAGEGLAPLWALVLLWCFNLLFGGSLGEELGWRGYALPRLLARHGPSTASSLLAVAWALWHAPIDLTYGFGLQGPGALVVRLLWTWPVAVIFTYFFLRARGSLLAPLALHTSFNVLSDIGTAALEPAILMLAVVNVAVAVPLSLRMERPPYWPRDAST